MATTERARRHVFLFQDGAVDGLRAGTTVQTIRKRRDPEVRPGDVLSLRQWRGGAYRSRQQAIVPDVVCLSVRPAFVRVNLLE